jgi:hypothetical protein
MIKIITNMSLEPLVDYEGEPKAKILLDGVWVNKFVIGDFLKKSIKFNNYYVVMTTVDIWEKSSLCVSFFDSKFNLLDLAFLGPRSCGKDEFSLIKTDQPDSVFFEYTGYWKIKFLPHKRPRLPFVTDPLSVMRDKIFSCHFLVTELAEKPA